MGGAAAPEPPKRCLVLPARGRLMVSTDLHGNGDDFRRLRALFLGLQAADAGSHWVQLGDVVHGPSEDARRAEPALYDYPDESWAIVDGMRGLAASHPGHFHFVLGNHDYGHIGGLHTNKFHADEVAHLESTLDAAERDGLHAFLRGALLAVVAPCGALLCHGSPDDTLEGLEQLDRIALPPAPGDAVGPRILRSWLHAYGQRRDVTERLLGTVSRGAGAPIAVVIHGHDRAEEGWFAEGGNQLCPVIFGAPRANKRYVLLDLAARYGRVDDLRDGIEIRRIHGEREGAPSAASDPSAAPSGTPR
jgi:hypothetical protein